MNPILDKQLCEKYPKIFVERNMSPQESCMHWGLACGDGWFSIIDTLCCEIQRHIDNPPYVRKTGWEGFKCSLKQLWNLTIWNKVAYPLIKGMRDKDKYRKYSRMFQFDMRPYEQSKNPISQVVFLQVKEKFSGLRIYASGGDVYTGALISFAESLSFKTCEVCGRMDDTVGRNHRGWQKTTCIEHAQSLTDFVKNSDSYNEVE
jgi:hypothetical protein